MKNNYNHNNDMKRKNNRPLIFLSGLLTALTLGSCSQTELLDTPGKESSKGSICISVSAPDAYNFASTRADAGLQLRYVAKLYKKKTSDPISGDAYQATTELLARNGNKIIFTGIEPGTYTVTLFADYVDDSATANTSGHYPDKFYNTTSNMGTIVMQSIKDPDGTTTYPNANINNDNYDCFATKINITKEEPLYESDVTLKRIVSKVSFIDSDGDKFGGLDKIKLTKYSFLYSYSFQSGSSDIAGEIALNMTDYPGMFEATDPGSKELFYFYTFGSTKNTPSSLYGINFSLTGKNGYEFRDVAINPGKIGIAPNYKYKVTGDFLHATVDPVQNEKDAKAQIHLTVTKDDNWSGDKESAAN